MGGWRTRRYGAIGEGGGGDWRTRSYGKNYWSWWLEAKKLKEGGSWEEMYK